jgi:hypothetical protein
MARSSGGDTLVTLLILGIGGYYVYTNFLSPTAQANAAAAASGGAVPPPVQPGTTPPASMVGSLMCKYPNGMTDVMNSDGTCPFDSTKGGQSTPCAGAGFVGPLQPGMSSC